MSGHSRKEVPTEVILNCFKHVGMYPDQETEMGDDPFAREKLLETEDLLSRISPDLDVSFVDVEVDAHFLFLIPEAHYSQLFGWV